MFSNAKNVNINGGEFLVTYGAKTSETAQKGIELLQKKIVPGALHNSDERYDPPKCHEHTREAILQEIMDWIEDMDRQTRIMWLHGPAGAGKSAIEQTIAEICERMKFLAASFFFSRSVGGRNEKTFLITTIVDQLIVAIPEIREHVGNALYNNPSLPSRSLEAQMEALVVKPFEAAAASRSADGVDFMDSRPNVIVLDGLDECGDPDSQRYILKVLLNSITGDHPIPFSFVLASRPEQHIREAFDGALLSSLTKRLVLDDKYHPDKDIRTFLQSKFQDIKHRHPSRAHLPSSWPSDKDVERLVQKSSGQFIYASTVIKFIDSHRHWPPDRLDIIFGISPRGKTTPFAEMDSLYLHILMSASENIETALDIFAVLLFLQCQDLEITPRFIESLLSLREGEVFMVLSDLHSVISVPAPDEPSSPLRLFHASLGDFLTDRSRSGENFFLDFGVCHRNIVNRIVKQVMNPASGLTHSEKESLQTAFLEQCLKATPDPEFISNLYEFDMSKCPHRLWVMSTPHIKQIFTEIFDSVNSSCRVPELLVWMQGQKHPDHQVDLFTHHLPSIDMWLKEELSTIKVDHRNPEITGHFIASMTLVDFPRFRDVHHLIPQVFDQWLGCTTEHDYRPIEDSGKWEIYLQYRQIVSRFLTDQTRSGRLFVGQNRYVGLAQHLTLFLPDGFDYFGKYDIDHPIILILPMTFAKAGPSGELDPLLKSWSLHVDSLYSATSKACKLAAKGDDAWMLEPQPLTTAIPKPGADHEVGFGMSTSKSNGLHMLSRIKRIFKSSKL